ncbi:MAG: hypothetical protein NDI60_09155 [Elusimicrobiales bacterium]|nr:hypothetical protein [Elusimicrobiales bacterium]
MKRTTSIFLLTALAALCAPPAPRAQEADREAAVTVRPGVIKAGAVVVYAPPDWKLELKGNRRLEAGIGLQSGAPVPGAATQNWVRLSLRRFNCELCYGSIQKAGLADFVKEMDCRVKRRLEAPFDCGAYFNRVKGADGYYYYFSHGKQAYFAAEDSETVTVLFVKNGFYFVAQLHFPAGRYDAYKAQLDYVVQNIKAGRN